MYLVLIQLLSPDEGTVKSTLTHQFPLRTLPAIGETPASRRAEGIYDAAVFNQKGAAAVGGLYGLEMVSVLGQIKVSDRKSVV